MLALELHMTVAEMRRKLSPKERRQWAAFLKIKREEENAANEKARAAAEKDAAKAGSKTASAPRTMGKH